MFNGSGFQDANGTLFHDVLYEGLDAVPPGITIIVVSREAPPARFARLQANGRIELLGWEQVRFTLEEAMEFVKARSADGVAAVELYQQAGEWQKRNCSGSSGGMKRPWPHWQKDDIASRRSLISS
ncbi:hypothetical protein [Geobacter argillaceus]|uniref:hypothetical protein n=1 Tax=Geobacter argillaceus TaxID=345631 RepID=UPI0011A9F43E|nr:hypothetical protein [Geobacter argillaceus]